MCSGCPGGCDGTKTCCTFCCYSFTRRNWAEGVDACEQPGIGSHVAYYAQLLEQGKLLIGGPYMLPHGGGMMVATSDVSEKELRAFAAADPVVKTGLLTFEIKSWYVPMRGV